MSSERPRDSFSFHYTVRVNTWFTRAEVELLGKLAALHYDSACRELASNRAVDGGATNGLLTIMGFHLEASHDATEERLGFRELDTLVKVLELAHLHRDLLNFKLADPLRRRLQVLLEAINGEVRRLGNPTLAATEPRKLPY